MPEPPLAAALLSWGITEQDENISFRLCPNSQIFLTATRLGSRLRAVQSRIILSFQPPAKSQQRYQYRVCLNWRGWRLLFTGDAEQRSWKTIWKRIKNKEVPFEEDFLSGSLSQNKSSR